MWATGWRNKDDQENFPFVYAVRRGRAAGGGGHRHDLPVQLFCLRAGVPAPGSAAIGSRRREDGWHGLPERADGGPLPPDLDRRRRLGAVRHQARRRKPGEPRRPPGGPGGPAHRLRQLHPLFQHPAGKDQLLCPAYAGRLGAAHFRQPGYRGHAGAGNAAGHSAGRRRSPGAVGPSGGPSVPPDHRPSECPGSGAPSGKRHL